MAETHWKPINEKEITIDRRLKHGDFGTRLYQIWADMKRRCISPKCSAFKDYGARGITLCDEWHDYIPFKKWDIENGYAENLEIDRKNNDKGYSPDNCKWSTRKEQQGNRRSCVRIEINGITKTLQEWSAFSGISIFTIRSRLKNPNCSDKNILRNPHKGIRLKGDGA